MNFVLFENSNDLKIFRHFIVKKDEWLYRCAHSKAVIIGHIYMVAELDELSKLPKEAMLCFPDFRDGNGKKTLKIEFLLICEYENFTIQKNIFLDVSIQH